METPKLAKAKHAIPSETQSCSLCGNPISGEFYRVNGQLACANCAAAVRAGKYIDSHAAFSQGLLFGIGAALLGLILYATFTIVTHLYLGYVSLAVGWMVGKAMIKGSNGVGGRRYQIAAVLLTYAAISLAAIPIRIAIIAPASDIDWGSEVGRLAFWGIASPLLDLQMGLPGFVGLVILCVGLRIAWKLTVARRLVVDGPHTVLD